MMTAETKQITLSWWEKLLNDEGLLLAWLKKLQLTEWSGYTGNIEANLRWNPRGPRYNSHASAFLKRTASDEQRHSNALALILLERGEEPVTDSAATRSSFYWDEMEKHVTSLETCCAMMYFGEQIAADRFEVLLKHPRTPNDLKGFLRKALPDEAYHAKGFAALAGPEAIAEMARVHTETMTQLLQQAPEAPTAKGFGPKMFIENR
jgi:hypothetical protein